MAVPTAITLYGIGDLANGDTNSQVRDATRVGGTIIAVGAGTQVATGLPGPSGDTAVMWTSSGGGTLTALPNAVVNTTATSFITGRVISSDGAVIGGSTRAVASGGSRQASVWTSNGTSVTGLGWLGTASAGNGAINGLSSDGSVGYGFSAYDGTGNQQAFRYTSGGGKVALGFLNGGEDASLAQAHAVSSDGTKMLGVSFVSTASNGVGPGSHSFLYTYTGSGVTGGTMTAMPLLSGGSWTTPLALTPDGTKAFGSADSTGFSNGQLVRWTNLGGSITADALGSPNTALSFSNLGGVTSDGAVVVGSWGDNNGNTGYFYNANGWFNFQSAMSAAGVNLTGWTLNDILGISPDGTLVYGDGTHNGVTEGYVFDLPAGYLASVTAIPEPSTAAMLIGAAGLGVVIWRRRRSHSRRR